jgi:hypothetical protein
VKGLRFNVIFRVQRFNIESGSLEPLDLTDSNVKLTIRQPERHVGQIAVRNDQDGAEFKRELVLTEEEAARAALLENDEERAHFIQQLPSTKAALAAVLEELRA